MFVCCCQCNDGDDNVVDGIENNELKSKKKLKIYIKKKIFLEEIAKKK